MVLLKSAATAFYRNKYRYREMQSGVSFSKKPSLAECKYCSADIGL